MAERGKMVRLLHSALLEPSWSAPGAVLGPSKERRAKGEGSEESEESEESEGSEGREEP